MAKDLELWVRLTDEEIRAIPDAEMPEWIATRHEEVEYYTRHLLSCGMLLDRLQKEVKRRERERQEAAYSAAREATREERELLSAAGDAAAKARDYDKLGEVLDALKALDAQAHEIRERHLAASQS